MSRKIKILTSVFSVVLVLIMACSVDVSAYSAYGIDNLPFEYEPHYPQTEQELSPDVKNEIMQKLMTDVYPDSNAGDIVVKYYGELSNGAMLINHYDKTYSYPKIENRLNNNSEYRIDVTNSNITFSYCIESQKDEVYLYIYGEFYNFRNAYLSKKIDVKMLGELVQKVDNLTFYIIPLWDDEPQKIGDIDADDRITVKDATEVQKYCASDIEFSELEKSLADVNGDGTVNVIDATEIQKIAINAK